jgi:hypothetical protein
MINDIAEKLIKELSLSISHHNIGSYYTFAEKWNKTFPKKDKESCSIVREISPKLGIAPTTIYSILSVTKKYPKRRYLLLQKKMRRANCVLLWSRIRMMSQCCGDKVHLLKQAEDLLLKNQYTEKEWSLVCHELAGKPIKAHRKIQTISDTKTKTKTKPISSHTLPELIDVIYSIASRLRYYSDSVLCGRFKLDTIKSFMPELEEAIDKLNSNHGFLMECCECGDIVKVGELEMQREHYNRYLEVRNKIEQSGKKQVPNVV